MKQFIFLAFFTIFLFSCNSVQTSEKNNNEETKTESATDGEQLASYTYKTYRIESSKPQEEGDTTVFQVYYPVFSDSKINDYIQQNLVLDSGKNTPEEMGTIFIHDYDEYYEQADFRNNWYYSKNDSVVVQTKDYIGLSSYMESYTGGAHGNYYTTFLNYDVKQNKEFAITDFISDYDALTTLAEGIFRKQKEITPTQSLSDAYFFEEGVFSLPKNFILEKEEILFMYNLYEIEPYVAGHTELIIPYSSIEHLLTDKAKAIIAEIKR